MTSSTPATWSWRTSASLAGLGIAGLGILGQYAGDSSLFGGFPPGIYFLAGAALLVVLTKRWTWSPIFSALMAAWVTFGGIVGGQLGQNLTSGKALVVVGAAVLQVGLAIALLAGIAAIVHNRRTRTRSTRVEVNA